MVYIKKLEIKKLGIGSVFKVTLYFAIIPIAIMVLVGIIAAIIGIASGARNLIFFGVAYTFMPIIMIFIYGLFSALFGLIYNGLAGKFGGLEIHVEEKDENEIAYK